jgi:hypothetical protein
MPDTDNNFANYYDQGPAEPLIGLEIAPVEPGQYDDLWKLSNAHGWSFAGFRVSGRSREDGQDLNRNCHGNTFEDGEIESGRNVAITCKGGSCGNLWRRVWIKGRGKFADIEFGNYSAQSREPSSGNILHDVKHRDGKPVRVAYGPGSKPIIQGGSVTIVWWYTALLHLYVPLKRILPFI